MWPQSPSTLFLVYKLNIVQLTTSAMSKTGLIEKKKLATVECLGTFRFSLNLHCQFHSSVEEFRYLGEILFDESPRGESRGS